MNVTNFIHLTDLHISHPDLEKDDPYYDTITTLRAVIEAVAGIEPRPSFVAVTGDLTNHGDVASYRYLREMLSALDMPFVFALGNHDVRSGFHAGMLDRPEGDDTPYFHDTTIDGVHVIVLDTGVPGRIGGALTEPQFAFLDEALNRHPDMQKIVMMHHAPSIGDDSGYQWERLGMDQSARLLSLIEGRNVAGILTGHIHYDRVSCWHGIPVVVGNGLQNSVDPTHQIGVKICDGASIGFCTLRASGLTVSFKPMPSDRRVLRIASDERARSHT